MTDATRPYPALLLVAAANALLPGTGTLHAGRADGWWQLMLTVNAGLLAAVVGTGAAPFPLPPGPGAAAAAAAVPFTIAWVWAAATSLHVLRNAPQPRA